MKRYDKRVTIRISSKDLDALKTAADELNETKSTFIKRSILYYLDYHIKYQLPLLQEQKKWSRYEEQE